MAVVVRKCASCNATMGLANFARPNGVGYYATCQRCRNLKKARRDLAASDGQLPNTKVRTCTRCGKTKPLAAFIEDCKHCRECQRERRGGNGE